MAGQTSWWGRMLAVVDREYERRIRAASLVTEYGASHGAHHDDDGDAAEIMNIPRGSRRPTFYAGDDESEDHHHAAV